MCAICGIVNRTGVVNQELVKKMARIMVYRGPDEEGFFFSETVGLGHRRLSIIDLETGKQPLSSEDNQIHLICNGEIFNFRELRTELEKKGHRFRSRSDSEVIIHLYEEKGFDCVSFLRGMFAFAIWDGRKKILFLARDRIGKKPLVYARTNTGFIFASEIKALLLHPDISREINLDAVDLFLSYQAVPSPYSIFQQIHKLPPAHCLVWEAGEVRTFRYWQIDFSRKIILKNEREYEELLWEKLKEAVNIRLVSDVPLGCFLSGGIDSSTVTGLMSSLSCRPVKTFTVGFEEADYSELEYAALVAKHFGTEHYQFVVKPDIIHLLPKLVWHYNEPFGDSSMVPTFYVARETRKYVKVALNGDGGDENLAGYPRYQQTKILEMLFAFYSSIPKTMRSRMAGFFLKKYQSFPQSTFLRAWKWLEETERYGLDYAYLRRLLAFSEEHKLKLYSPWMRGNVLPDAARRFSAEIWKKSGEIDLLEKMMFSDFHLYLPEVLTVKMDIATMANSLEARSPFLDHKFVETVAAFPRHLKMRRLVSKYILKKKLKEILPGQILQRKKMGFGLPVGYWFQRELKGYLYDVLLSSQARKRPYFQQDYVRQMIEEHTTGKTVHTTRLWCLLNLELWHQVFVDKTLAIT